MFSIIMCCLFYFFKYIFLKLSVGCMAAAEVSQLVLGCIFPDMRSQPENLKEYKYSMVEIKQVQF